MAMFLDAGAADFEAKFAALLAAKREAAADVDAVVAEIIADVRARGDAALADYSRRFDRIDYATAPLKVTAAEIDAAVAACPKEQVEALKFAHGRILSFHQRQVAQGRGVHRRARRQARLALDAPSRPSGSMCRAARRAIRPRC